MKYIHVHCRARWRDSAQNGGRARSECPNCHFKYRTATWGAVSWMSHPSFVGSVTVIVCIVLIAFFYYVSLFVAATTGGALSIIRAILQEDADGDMILGDLNLSTPAAAETHMKADALVTSMVLFGIAGLVLSTVRGVETPSFLRDCRCNRHHGQNNRPMLLLAMVAAIFVGTVLSFYAIYDTVKHFVTSGRDRLQEYVLDVRDLELHNS